MEFDGAVLHQLGDWRVEADDNVLGDFEHDTRPPGGHFPPLAGRVAMPGSAHAQVGMQREAIVEADQHVLSQRLNGCDSGADDAVNGWTRRSGFRGQDGLADQQRPEGGGRLVDRVAFRHSWLEDGSVAEGARPARGTRAENQLARAQRAAAS